MRVLSHGVPFGNDRSPLRLYRGTHDLRSLGGPVDAHPYHAHAHDYIYDPACDSFDDILARLGDWQPDLALFWYPANTPPPFGVEHAPCRTVAIVSDWNLYYPRLAGNLGRYDLVLCDKPGVAVLKAPGVEPVHQFPLYAHITGIHRKLAVEKDIDVVYVGSQQPAQRPERARYLERLARLSDRYQIRIATGYDREDYTRLLNRARIIFNHSVRGELNLRVFETLACGALAFLEAENQEVGDCFEDGEDLVLYNSDNFETRVRYFLKHTNEAEAIAARGHARAAEFAGEYRFDAFIDWAARQHPAPRAFNALAPPEQQYQTALQYSRSWAPGCRTRCRDAMAAFLRGQPQEARAWALMAMHLTNPYAPPKDRAALADPLMEAVTHAQVLAPENAVHVLNVAWACRYLEYRAEEERALQEVLRCDVVGDGELLLGDYQDPFYLSWVRALAEKRAAVSTIHAEAALRLARFALDRGESAQTATLLDRVEEMDTFRGPKARLAAEAAWRGGRQHEAVSRLSHALPWLPFDMEARTLLETWLRRLGEQDQADGLHEVSARIAGACEVRPLPCDAVGEGP